MKLVLPCHYSFWYTLYWIIVVWRIASKKLIRLKTTTNTRIEKAKRQFCGIWRSNYPWNYLPLITKFTSAVTEQEIVSESSLRNRVMSVLRRRRDQQEQRELDTAESGLADNFTEDSPHLHRRIVAIVVGVSVILAVSWLFINVPATMTKEGRLSPDDPTSYARIGELELNGLT